MVKLNCYHNDCDDGPFGYGDNDDDDDGGEDAGDYSDGDSDDDEGGDDSDGDLCDKLGDDCRLDSLVQVRHNNLNEQMMRILIMMITTIMIHVMS